MSYKNQFSVLVFGVLMGSSLFVTDQAQAEIFKCVDRQGAVYYNDKPCPEKDTETQIRNTRDPKGAATTPQVFSNLQVVVDENLSNKELSNLRSQQKFDFMREQSGASEDDERVIPSSEDRESLNYDG